MVTKKTMDRLYVLMILIVFIFMIFLGRYVYTNKEAFFENPFIFGASKLNGNVECVCSPTEVLDSPYRFKFNSTNMWDVPVNDYWMP